MSKASWSDIVTWAKREIEIARTTLETVTDASDIARVQARIAVMRDLQKMPDLPAAPDIPAPVGY